jgi:hypothetical protein
VYSHALPPQSHPSTAITFLNMLGLDPHAPNLSLIYFVFEMLAGDDSGVDAAVQVL